jgi:DnaJ-class molecular chaperone
MDFKDYYTTLGLKKDATSAEIKRAYRKLARTSHPDLHPGDKAAEARFKEINEANEVLGDPEKRRKYDELGTNWRAYEQAARDGGGTASPGDWSVHQGGGRGTYRTMSPEDMQDMFGANEPFSDFFQAYFGDSTFGASRKGRSARARAPRRGHDLEHAVDLTLEEVFSGATRRLITSRDGHERTIEVRIPAGVNDGARVRAAGEGGPPETGGAAGDLYLIVRVLPHPRFERRGQDLHVRVPVPITTAVLGGDVGVPTLSGSTLRLKVPALTTSGRVFRLRGHGLPTVGRPVDRGELYATIELQVPASLTDEARKHYEALKELDGSS